ncbi:RlpA-like double-psi beta-barrel-protein domain-containing protein-containing protein [Rhodofomes roseus]|uniref:RlpA-like double-psi beta-barrel-protein domain-containing protein-containing protein n=1 Tax=Rhodofomes roseus TaxID=34475 RepID=A0ABQ8KI64_9APHY|nr:RlpA-like double-psi beta-barrel-protein domain-containing protein-containing protein [Rhodofomes roseus]KAH9837648.1 RlpA-like double-psi beta-barrel-protein domain-containing protein-containing protein [Rhodofomes roseus]
MSRFAMLAVFLGTLTSIVTATPIDGGEIEVLEKRVTHTGKATYYYPGLGACGETDGNNDPVVAISHLIYGSGGNCFQYMQITNPATGTSQYAKTVDECEGCGQYDIDLSPSLFESLGAPLSQGVINGVEWHFMAKGWSP